MSFYPSIQSYGLSTSAQNVPIDWINNLVWFTGETYPNGFLYLYGFLTGTVINSVNINTFTTPPSIFAIGYDGLGQIYLGGDGGNYTGATVIEGSTLVQIQDWGSSHSFDTTPPHKYTVPAPIDYTCTSAIGAAIQFMLSVSEGGITPHTIDILPSDDTGITITSDQSSYFTSWPSAFGTALSCPGVSGGNFGYVGSGPANSSVSPKEIQIFQIGNGVDTSSTPIIITAADIDNNYSEIYLDGMCIDQGDANLLIACHGQTDATVNGYLIKLQIGTGTVLWRVPLPGTCGGSQMKYSSVTHNQFGVFNNDGLGGYNTVTLIDTSTGDIISQTTTGYSGLTGGSNQCYNDTLSCIFLHLLDGAAGGTNEPTPINSTPSSFNGHATLYIAPPYSEPQPLTQAEWGSYFSTFWETNYLDWDTVEGTDYSSYLYTYYMYEDGDALFFETPWLVTYLDNTTDQGPGTPVCNVTPVWDWTDMLSTQRQGPTLNVYKARTAQNVSDARTHIRGRGHALQLQFTSSEGSPFGIYGWSLEIDRNANF